MRAEGQKSFDIKRRQVSTLAANEYKIPIKKKLKADIKISYHTNHPPDHQGIMEPKILVAPPAEETKSLIKRLPSIVSFRQLYYLRPISENLLRRTRRRHRRVQGKRTRSSFVYGISLILILLIIQGIFPFPKISQALQASTVKAATDGLHNLELAQYSLKDQKFTEAQKYFQDATKNFKDSLSMLQVTGQASSILPFLVSNPTYSTAQAILYAATDISDSGSEMSSLAISAMGLLKQPDSEADKPSDDPFAHINFALTKFLSDQPNFLSKLVTVKANLDHASWMISNYANQPVSNPDIELARQTLLQKLPPLVKSVNLGVEIVRDLPSVLGSDRNRRYLVLFLNNTELRPSGGFLGSFATTILNKGSVNGFAVETNIYKLDETYSKIEQINPPYPISQLNQNWFMRDSNWDVNYAAANEKVAWFYKKEAGLDVDGVLSIDTSVIISLLQLTGPIDIPSQNTVVTADNFLPVVQYKVEKEYLNNPEVNALNEPKKILADMFPIFLQKIFQTLEQKPSEVMDTISTNFKQKHLLFSANFDQGSRLASVSGLDNALPKAGDFIMINNANLGGMKSSLNVDEKVNINLEPTDHQTLLHTITITRTHNGSGVWPDGDNKNYVRIVIPKKAIYIDSSSNGNDAASVSNEAQIEFYNGYQTIGRWLTTPVGETKQAMFKYETPINSNFFGTSSYGLQYIKQPGWTGDDLTISFKNNYGWNTDKDFLIHGYQQTNGSWSIPLIKQGSLSSFSQKISGI